VRSGLSFRVLKLAPGIGFGLWVDGASRMLACLVVLTFVLSHSLYLGHYFSFVSFQCGLFILSTIANISGGGARRPYVSPKDKNRKRTSTVDSYLFLCLERILDFFGAVCGANESDSRTS